MPATIQVLGLTSKPLGQALSQQKYLSITEYSRGYNCNKTRSSAVAKRLSDMSCPSPASFNSTIPQVHFLKLLFISALDLAVRTIRFCSVVFGVTSSLAVIRTIHVHCHCVYRETALGHCYCTQSRTTMTAYSAWRLVVRYTQPSKTRSLNAINLPVQHLLITKPDICWESSI